MSALIALETNPDRARSPALLNTLIGLLRAQDDEEWTDADVFSGSGTEGETLTRGAGRRIDRHPSGRPAR